MKRPLNAIVLTAHQQDGKYLGHQFSQPSQLASPRIEPDRLFLLSSQHHNNTYRSVCLCEKLSEELNGGFHSARAA